MAQAWSPEQMEALALLQEGMRRIYADEDAALVLDWLHGQTGKAPATPDDVLRWGESFAFYDQVLADRALRSLLPPEQRKEISFPWKSYNLHIDTPDEGMLMLLGAGPGSGKCLGKGTKLLMYDGTRKAVEDVVVGDQLMGILQGYVGRQQRLRYAAAGIHRVEAQPAAEVADEEDAVADDLRHLKKPRR
jgi:hypothetical protein